MKIDKLNLKHWFYLVWIGIVSLMLIPLRSILKNSRRGVVILYGHKLHGNLYSIYDYFDQMPGNTPYECYFLTLDPFYYNQIKENRNILLAQNLLHLTKVVSAECIVSDHGLHSFILLLKLTKMKFFDVWHGIPYKGFIPSDFKAQHDYDEIWVSSRLLRDLYINEFGFDGDKVFVTGYGRTDIILKYQKEADIHRKKLGIPNNKNIILFAPTWKQDSSSRNEIPFGLSSNQFLKELNDFSEHNDAFVLVRYHLNTSETDLHQFANMMFLPIATFPNSELVVGISDVLITDWSSIAFDMMVTDNPIVFLDVPAPFQNGFSLPPDFRPGDKVKSMDALLRSLSEICHEREHYINRYQQEYNMVRDAVYDDTLDGKSAERYLKRLELLLAEE